MKTTYTLEENNQTGTISGLDCASAQSRLSLSLSLSVSASANRTDSPKTVSSRLYFGRLILFPGVTAVQA
jgi:hypothetical protein